MLTYSLCATYSKRSRLFLNKHMHVSRMQLGVAPGSSALCPVYTNYYSIIFEWGRYGLENGVTRRRRRALLFRAVSRCLNCVFVEKRSLTRGALFIFKLGVCASGSSGRRVNTGYEYCAVYLFVIPDAARESWAVVAMGTSGV